MNKITYRFSLDVHKNGIQRILQGIESTDSLQTKLEIGLSEAGKTYELPDNATYAVLYVRKPSGLIDMESVTINGNTLECYLSQTTLQNPGITECQLRILDDERKAITSPRFALEIWESIMTLEEEAEGDDKNTFSRLEDAIVEAGKAAGSIIIGVDFKNAEEEDYTLVFERADGASYKVPGLTELMEDIRAHSKGVPGDAATIEVGTVSYADEDVEVVNVGDENHAIFNFKIPKGDKGDAGNPGVYISETEPEDEDAKVWIKPTSDVDILVTEDVVASMISEAIGGALNGRY